MTFENPQAIYILGGAMFLSLIFWIGHLLKKSSKNRISPSVSQDNLNDSSLKNSQEEASPSFWFNRLANGLQRTRQQIVLGLDDLFLSKKDKITRDDILEHLFESLIQADVGVSTSERLIAKVKEQLNKQTELTQENLKSILKAEILSLLTQPSALFHGSLESPGAKPYVVLMVGVNGVGKTTTTGKLAFKSHQRSQKAVIGAADTFRAAAVEQLSVWADRSKASLIQLKEGSDPASVAFEAVKQAISMDADVCFVDTAGRLQTRQDLMQELSKIKRVMSKAIPQAPHEVLLVLDATTGQNALQQAKMFQGAVDVTGLVLTKLDGTAKGGIALAIASELQLPIRYVGVGEQVEDLEVFCPQEFTEALFVS